jgi:hypothetical protein
MNSPDPAADGGINSHSAVGFVDVHYHAAPDLYDRRHSVLEAGRRYASRGGWIVLKNHLGCTAAQAHDAREQGLPVSGSVVLNGVAGGLDPQAVLGSVHRNGAGGGRDPAHPHLADHKIAPLTVSGSNGRLLPAVFEILRLARDLDLVVSTGHANADEVVRLVDPAVQVELPVLMLNQPAGPLTGLRYEDLVDLAKAPMVYTEQTALTYLLGYQDEDDFRAVLGSLPRTVYSSDLGQPSQPDIEEWLRLSDRWFTMFGLSEARIAEITLESPSRMLGLEHAGG